jgi:ATP-binding cassette subfamily B protein
MLIFPIMIIGFMSNVIAQATASFQRISVILNAPDPVEEKGASKHFARRYRAEKCVVRYGEKPALKDVNHDGESRVRKTAVIGPTAAGKTQLLYLLTGLIAPQEGSVNLTENRLIITTASRFTSR